MADFLNGMDWSDLIPIVPPSLPGERASVLTREQRFAAGVASTLLPLIDFLLVLFAGFAAGAAIALTALPLASATLAFVVSRRLATPVAWAILIAFGCAVFCLMGDAFALLLRGFAQLFHAF